MTPATYRSDHPARAPAQEVREQVRSANSFDWRLYGMARGAHAPHGRPRASLSRYGTWESVEALWLVVLQNQQQLSVC